MPAVVEFCFLFYLFDFLDYSNLKLYNERMKARPINMPEIHLF